MSEVTRRDFGWAMAAFAMLAGAAEGESGSQADAAMGTSTVYRYSELPVKTSTNGVESRAVMHGTLPSGEFVEVHETMLPAGQMPHPPHRHSHSEFILIREGMVEHWNNGKTEPPAGAGRHHLQRAPGRARVEECRHNACEVLCGGGGRTEG